MAVLVTGASGFIGRHLQTALRASGQSVVSANRSSGYDVCDYTSLQTIGEFNTAVHLAAKTFVPSSFDDSFGFFETNVRGTLNILELCKARHARLVFLSSYVYGPPQHLPIDESHPVCHWNPYASSKLIGEQMCEAFATHFDMDIVILRLFNVYGPGQSSEFLIPRIVAGARAGHIQLQTAKPRRDFVHVHDVVRAIEMVRTCPLPGLNVFNVGSGISFSVDDVVRLVTAQLPNVSVEYSGVTRSGEVMDVVADCRKLTQQTGWEPAVDFRQGLGQLVQETTQA